MAKRLHDEAPWPEPKIVILVTRVSADVEGCGVEIPQWAFKQIFDVLYWSKKRDVMLCGLLKNLWKDYLLQMRDFLIQRSFGLYARVPWSMTKTLSATRSLRNAVFGEGNDERQMPGLLGSDRTVKTGPVLQTDVVLSSLGAKEAGRNSKSSRRVAGKKRAHSRS